MRKHVRLIAMPESEKSLVHGVGEAHWRHYFNSKVGVRCLREAPFSGTIPT